MRRAVAIQLIINRELGLNFCENPWQGSFIDRRAHRPRRGGGLRGVRPASPSAAACSARWTRCTSAARSRTRASTTRRLKHDGTLPLIGVNTFLPDRGPGRTGRRGRADALDRRGEAGRRSTPCAPSSPRDAEPPRRGARPPAQDVARARGNVFEALMEAVKVASLGADLRRPLRRRRRVPAQHVERAMLHSTAASAMRGIVHGRRRRRADRLPRAEHHRAALRPRARRAARRPHRASASTRGRPSARSRRSAGTKDVKLDRIRELAPTHVVVNVDENRRETVEELAGFVPPVVVTHPLGPRDNLDLYRLLGGIFGRERGGRGARAPRFEVALDRLRAARRDRAQRRSLPDLARALDDGRARHLHLADARRSFELAHAAEPRRPTATRRSTSPPSPGTSTRCC